MAKDDQRLEMMDLGNTCKAIAFLLFREIIVKRQLILQLICVCFGLIQSAGFLMM